jgi:hypothetical protein
MTKLLCLLCFLALILLVEAFSSAGGAFLANLVEWLSNLATD